LHFGLNTIGRMHDNDVVLSEEYISRRHCTIVVHHNGECELYDVASKNGTFVNDQRIDKPIALSNGDRISLSNRTLIFRVTSSSSSRDSIPTAEPV
jgi:pSer/pThr/pTyr-binding forkhead associated (FHA) protein